MSWLPSLTRAHPPQQPRVTKKYEVQFEVIASAESSEKALENVEAALKKVDEVKMRIGEVESQRDQKKNLLQDLKKSIQILNQRDDNSGLTKASNMKETLTLDLLAKETELASLEKEFDSAFAESSTAYFEYTEYLQVLEKRRKEFEVALEANRKLLP